MLNDTHRQVLRDVALESIRHGLEHGRALEPALADYDDELTQARASFVTLHSHDRLRGCIGTLEPVRPLVEDVAHNAFAAAFMDSRFDPLSAGELDSLTLHISVLNQPEAIAFDNEQDLIDQLRPGVDGLILQDMGRRATFLPSVWESLDSGRSFLRHLKLKAGLPENYWSDSMRIQRYTVDSF